MAGGRAAVRGRIADTVRLALSAYCGNPTPATHRRFSPAKLLEWQAQPVLPGSGEDVLDDVAFDVGEAELAAGEAVFRATSPEEQPLIWQEPARQRRDQTKSSSSGPACEQPFCLSTRSSLP